VNPRDRDLLRRLQRELHHLNRQWQVPGADHRQLRLRRMLVLRRLQWHASRFKVEKPADRHALNLLRTAVARCPKFW
jgi:hypothetical protein